jgi:hypothetical protein
METVICVQAYHVGGQIVTEGCRFSVYDDHMNRAILPGFVLILVIVEVLFALTGPMAFVQKPSVIVALPYTYNMEADDIDVIFDHIQGSFARTRVFRVISHGLIEDYFLEKQDNPDFAIDERMSFNDYMELAGELDLERVAILTVYPGGGQIDIAPSGVLKPIPSPGASHTSSLMSRHSSPGRIPTAKISILSPTCGR